MFKISILLATYNWPEALRFCLESLEIQTDRNFEIIIAGSESLIGIERQDPIGVCQVKGSILLGTKA